MNDEPPTGLKAGGLRLWESIQAEYDLQESEVQILELACRCRDRIDQLEALIEKDGALGFGDKISPVVVESRQQQLLLAKFVIALRVPDVDTDERPQRRSMRGVYMGTRRRMIEERRAALRVVQQP
jgi:hypothetical protein